MKKTKLATKEFHQCDFCSNDDSTDKFIISTCVVCGNDICNDKKHNIEGCEDGVLCPNCSSKYEFRSSNAYGEFEDEAEDGGNGEYYGIGVYIKGTDKAVHSPFL